MCICKLYVYVYVCVYIYMYRYSFSESVPLLVIKSCWILFPGPYLDRHGSLFYICLIYGERESKSWSLSVVSDSLRPHGLGSPVPGIFWARVLEWVAIFFSRGSSQPKDRTQVSRIAGRRSTLWATREALDAREYLLTLIYLSMPSIPFGNYNFVSYVWKSVSVL